MTYTTEDFRTKKALKAAVAAHKAGEGPAVTTWEPGTVWFGHDIPKTETVYLEGPHYPKPHTWYATAKVDADGNVVSVK